MLEKFSQPLAFSSRQGWCRNGFNFWGKKYSSLITGAVHAKVKKLALILINSIPCGALGFPTIFEPSQALLLMFTVIKDVGRLVPIEFRLMAKN